MVKFQIMSDLHIETLSDSSDISKFITPSAEVLILAGDIGRVHRYEQLENFLLNLCPKFQIVLYVLGNHEYYCVHNIIPKTMDEIFTDIKKIQSKIPNLYILNRNSVIIDDVCITGCTLWSQAFIEIPQYIVRIPDMNREKYNSLFRQDLDYIHSMITYCEEKNLKLVVVTHHAPTFLVGKRKNTDKYKSLYCSSLDYLLDGKKIHTWICGHVHKNFDFSANSGTRLVGNQRGKGEDVVMNYSLEKVITV